MTLFVINSKFQIIYFRFKVVVTQKAKKEMANAEKAAQKKLNQRTKLGKIVLNPTLSPIY